MTRDIREYVRSCHICQLNKFKSCKYSGPWQAVIPWRVGELIAVDILGPLVTSVYGYTCVFVIVDIFSKFTKIYGLKRATSTTCINSIRRYIGKYGPPRRIFSDNGPQFVSKKWKRYLREMGIKEVHTAIRNPRGNPTERYMNTIGNCLRIVSGGKHSSWVRYLTQIEHFINYSYSEATESIPVELQMEKDCT